jgi:hypothetical protein
MNKDNQSTSIVPERNDVILSDIDNLIELNAGNQKFSNREGLFLANVLHQNTSLIKINLALTQLGAEGAVSIAKALHVNTTLRKDGFNNYHDGDCIANAFAEMLLVNTYE